MLIVHVNLVVLESLCTELRTIFIDYFEKFANQQNVPLVHGDRTPRKQEAPLPTARKGEREEKDKDKRRKEKGSKKPGVHTDHSMSALLASAKVKKKFHK
jgi:hypothetical protein